jgi:hypothetical protein
VIPAQIQKFLDEEIVNGTKLETLRTYTTTLRRANDFKPLSDTWTREDVNSFVISLSKEMPKKDPPKKDREKSYMEET